MVILFKGKESIKKVHGKDKNMTPFAGTLQDGSFVELGVGLIDSNSQPSMLWGLAMPHDVVASYRGMKIAEVVPVFSHGTLAACWYAGKDDGHSSERDYIESIEKLIGVEKRQEILKAPLPSFDDAIRLMQEKSIDFNVEPFLREIKTGNLSMTPILNKAVNDYSDDVLLFRGLKDGFKEAYVALTKPKNVREFFFGREADSKHTELARSYALSFEPAIPNLVADLETQIESLSTQTRNLKFDESALHLDQREITRLARNSIYDSQSNIRAAIKSLKSAPRKSSSANERFIIYHGALDAVVRLTSDVTYHLLRLRSNTRSDEPVIERLYAAESTADSIARTVNRTAREQLPQAYSIM